MSMSHMQKQLWPFNDFMKSRRPYWIFFFWKLIGGLVPISPLDTPMVIESKCMYLSQMQKELWPF